MLYQISIAGITKKFKLGLAVLKKNLGFKLLLFNYVYPRSVFLNPKVN